MEKIVARNEAFLRNIYKKGPVEGHGFVCTPAYISTSDAQGRDYTLTDRPIPELASPIIKNYERRIQLLQASEHDGVPHVDITTGTHIFAAAFGSAVHTYEDNNPIALPLVSTPDAADQLEVPDIWKTPVLYRIFEMAYEIRKRLGSDVPHTPPDIQTGFDVACMVWDKQEIFIAMIDEDRKEAVKRLVDKCAMLVKEFLTSFLEEFPNVNPCICPDTWAPPEMGPWVSNDECGSLSNHMFEEFCLPEMVELSEHFGGLAMHCCAQAEHQFESFKKIPNFYAFNRVEAAEGYAPLLKHFAGPEDPVHVLCQMDDETVEMLIHEGSPDMRYIFTCDQMNKEDSKKWLEKMRRIEPSFTPDRSQP